MSHFHYKEAQELSKKGYQIHSLIMATMLKSDSIYSGTLRRAFPHIWEELVHRISAPRGKLEGENCGAIPAYAGDPEKQV